MTKKSRVAKAVAKSRNVSATKRPEPVVNVPAWDADEIPFTTKWQPTRYVHTNTVTTCYVLVTPHIAAQMMGFNIDNNRRIDPRTVTQYALAMKDKEWWWQAWMPIHFSDEARLINGQHRLQAIIESGESLPCMIVYNVPKDAVRGIDAGKKRTIAQQITLQGRDTKNAEVTIARYILAAHGDNNSSLTYSGPVSNIEQFLTDYDRSVKFAMRHLPMTGPGAVKVPGKNNRKLGLISGAVHAAFAQAHAVAWLHNNTRMIGDIAEFARQLMAAGEMIATGNMSAEDADELEVSEAAQKLAMFLLVGSGAGTRADSNKGEKYRKTVWVLRRFLDGEDFVRVNEARHNVFELPIDADEEE